MDPGKPFVSGIELNSNLKDPQSSKEGGQCTLLRLRSRATEARQAVWSDMWDVLQSQAKCERSFRLATALTVRALIIKGVDRPTIAKAQFSLSEQQSQHVQGRGKTCLSRNPVAPGIKRRAPLMTCKQPTHDSHSFKEVGHACTQENGGKFASAQFPAGHWQRSRYLIENRHNLDLLRDTVPSSIRRAISNPVTTKPQQTHRLKASGTLNERPVSQQLSPCLRSNDRIRRASSVY